MTNALREFKNTLDNLQFKVEDITSIVIVWQRSYNEGPNIIINSKEGSITLGDIARLDFEYDNGYGGQELFGTVVFKDGSWLDRGEYDGSEWWDYHRCPSYDDIIEEISTIGYNDDFKKKLRGETSDDL